ncbi:hypothetical protein GIB67_024514 [Kingdonia uniflora]|uniref:F-box domain-containing protein n=1 Tax=Kingdonia uniflora TaxID=39325 RepID=A0A7J7LNS6_9MAGN|nr:hypothetical protein GIB67_024514 [Kingdonia uniflora]
MEFRPWSDLPQELMEMVMKDLFIADEARVRSVCKNWNSVRHVQPVNQLPLLLMSKAPNLQPIFDPSSKQTCNLNFNPRGDHVLASKHGWLLMRHGLPIHLLSGIKGGRQFVTLHVACNPYRCQMVYMDGSFYIGDLRGKVEAFNVNNQKWSVLLEHTMFEGLYRNFLLEFGGELLLVMEYLDGSNKRKSVSRLNKSMKRWETVESLGDQVLFLGPTSSSVSESSATPRIRNLIYTCERRSRPEYYSLEGEIGTYSGLNPYSLTNGKGVERAG